MESRESLIEKYKAQITVLEEQLAAKRFELGEADSAKESRFPTGRVELEDRILQAQNKLQDTKELLKSLQELPVNTDKTNVSVGSVVSIELDGEAMTFIITKTAGDFAAGILTVESSLGKILQGKKAGDSVTMTNNGYASTVNIISIA